MFVVLLGVGTFSIGSSINSLVLMTTFGSTDTQLAVLVFSLVVLAVSVAGACFLLYRLDLGRGRIKRRVRAFEVGWKE
jgi:hypothetical protein